MSLLSLQRTMARAVMQPLTSSEKMRTVAPNGEPMTRHAARFIKPNDRLTSFERLEIYNRQYWFRLMAGLMEDFPGLQAILGDKKFELLCRAYLQDCPSRSFTLRNLGRDLEKWMTKNPRWAGSQQRIALDMVLLEWADIEAFDGRAEKPFQPGAAARSAGARLRLKLQPYIQLLHLRYPVDDLVLKIKSLNNDTEFSSNAFREKRKRKQVQAVARLKPADIFLVVHRVDFFVYFRRVTAEEFYLLQALRMGKTLGQAIAAGFGKQNRSAPADPALVTKWFQNWASLGWFRAPESREAKG